MDPEPVCLPLFPGGKGGGCGCHCTDSERERTREKVTVLRLLVLVLVLEESVDTRAPTARLRNQEPTLVGESERVTKRDMIAGGSLYLPA